MVDNLNQHYSMNNPASIYDEEALTALELVGRLAQKIKEVVDLVNKNELTVEEAYQYLVDNLPDNVEKAVEKLKNSGDLETILVKAVSSGKVDKNGVGQITYDMLAQSVREMFTGGNTPVVGEGAVSTVNIVDKSISESKLKLNTIDTVFYSPDKNAYTTPLIKLSSDTHTATVNDKFTYISRLIGRDCSYEINVNTLTVDTSEWSYTSVDMYYNPTTNVIKIVDALHRSETVRQCVFIGAIYGSELVCTSLIPVTYDNRFYIGGGGKNLMSHLPMASHSPVWYDTDRLTYKPSGAFFDINLESGEVTIKSTKTVPVPVHGKIYSINFANVTSRVESIGGHTCVWFNPVDNELCFASMNTAYWIGKDNCLFLGVVVAGAGHSCIIPHTINGQYYVNVHVNPRPEARLMIMNTENTGAPTVGKVDFIRRELVFPVNTILYYIFNNQYLRILKDDTSEYRVPFADGNYQYLMGGENGLKFVGVTELSTGKYQIDGCYYLGFVNLVNQEIQLTFNAEKALSVSILGDSVSTFANLIPSGNANFYTAGRYNVNSFHQTWWGRVLDRCGLTLCVNNSWSGAKVSESGDKGFVTRSMLLDTGISGENPAQTPDIVFVFGGYNDYTGNVATNVFKDSYNLTLDTIHQLYPEAHIYCLTLPFCNRVRTDGLTVAEFNEVIKQCARDKHCTIVDTESCGIHQHNGDKYCGDYATDTGTFLHPNAEGMKLIANKVIKSVLNSQEV